MSDFHYWCSHDQGYCMRSDPLAESSNDDSDEIDRQAEDYYRAHSSSITGIIEGI